MIPGHRRQGALFLLPRPVPIRSSIGRKFRARDSRHWPERLPLTIKRVTSGSFSSLVRCCCCYLLLVTYLPLLLSRPLVPGGIAEFRRGPVPCRAADIAATSAEIHKRRRTDALDGSHALEELGAGGAGRSRIPWAPKIRGPKLPRAGGPLLKFFLVLSMLAETLAGCLLSLRTIVRSSCSTDSEADARSDLFCCRVRPFVMLGDDAPKLDGSSQNEFD